MKRVRVASGHSPYDVVIGDGALSASRLRKVLGSGATGLVVSSRKVMALHGARLLRALDEAGFQNRRVVLLPDGEGAKTAGAWETLVGAMARAELDRSSYVIAFGGGSVGDAAGFAAATYMRGIRFVQIPTTLLSMVDSSVGGKTGINLREGKNLVGAFHQPALVLADLTFLETLPPRERQSGVYEIVKCGLLRSAPLLKIVKRTRGLRQASGADLQTAVALAVSVKARIVERDERESGERVLLNFGHTLGHAIEAATSYRLFTHGEAVGYGMEFAVDMSVTLGLTSTATAQAMRAVIHAVGSRVPIPRGLGRAAGAATVRDKKRQGARLKEVLLRGPGRPEIVELPAAWLSAQTATWLRLSLPARAGSGRPSGHAGDCRPAERPRTAIRPSPRR